MPEPRQLPAWNDRRAPFPVAALALGNGNALDAGGAVRDLADRLVRPVNRLPRWTECDLTGAGNQPMETDHVDP